MATQQHDQIRQHGRDDYLAGKPITAYYDLPLRRHPESLRAFYELGWREAKAEAASATQRIEERHKLAIRPILRLVITNPSKRNDGFCAADVGLRQDVLEDLARFGVLNTHATEASDKQFKLARCAAHVGRIAGTFETALDAIEEQVIDSL